VAAAPGTTDFNDLYSTQGTMKELASATGGQAFTNTNDLARVMRAAADDSEASYTLGFYPHDIRWDNKYHALKVEVSRHGVHLRYRQGYFANPGNFENSKDRRPGRHPVQSSHLRPA